MKTVIPIPPIITPKYPIDFVFSLTEIKIIIRVASIFTSFIFSQIYTKFTYIRKSNLYFTLTFHRICFNN